MAVFDVTPNIGGNKLVPGNGVSITNEAVSIRAINSCDNTTSISKNGIYTYIPFEGKTFPLIEVTVRAENLFGISVTATQGETVVSGTTNADGIATLEVSAFGPWAVWGHHECRNDLCYTRGHVFCRLIFISGYYFWRCVGHVQF